MDSHIAGIGALAGEHIQPGDMRRKLSLNIEPEDGRFKTLKKPKNQRSMKLLRIWFAGGKCTFWAEAFCPAISGRLGYEETRAQNYRPLLRLRRLIYEGQTYQ